MKKTIITLFSIFLIAPASLAQIQQGPWNDLLDHYNSMYSDRLDATTIFGQRVVAKAQPDECYDNGTVGAPDEAAFCSRGSPKVNQSYVWGMTQSKNIWFGTAANPLCLVFGALYPTPVETPAFVCELGKSHLVPPLPATLGDWRPPQMYEYNPATGELKNRTPMDPLVSKTLGIRSAGAHNGVVLLAGPSLGATAINIFAFSDNGTFLGSQALPHYNNIRQWLEHEGILYTAVSTTVGGKGRILRWNGSRENLFNFEIVGKLDLDGANIAIHEGRIFVTTWPKLKDSTAIAGLWMSPVIPPEGLSGGDNDSWQKVWSVNDYEPDMLVAHTYAGGALASFEGVLYWGTMHVPFAAAQVAQKAAESGIINLKGADNVTSTDDAIATVLGTHRAISIFSGRNFGAPEQQIEILYGDQYLPVYDNASRSYTIAYDHKHQNKMPNPVPKLGSSGIGNFWNAYTWTMAIGFKNTPHVNKLLIGTFDWSYVADQLIAMYEEQLPDNQTYLLPVIRYYLSKLPPHDFGADLLMVDSPDTPFMLCSNNGLENYLNYGIRTMLVPDGSAQPGWDNQTMYIGMANPFNLETTEGKRQGGWELIQLYKFPPSTHSTTTSVTTTTTARLSSTTTTITNDRRCPVKKVLGAYNPQLENLRHFRDSTLVKSTIGRKIAEIYYNNADRINAALERSPALRAFTRRVLELIAPMVGRRE